MINAPVNKRMKQIAFTLFLILIAASSAWAQCSRISFARGKTSTVINGNTGVNKQVCYKLHAREGQRMGAHVTSTGKRARLSILPDEYDGDFVGGADNVTDWEGELGSASGAGDFLIVVSSTKPRVAYVLEISIPPSKSTASTEVATPR